MNFGEGRGGSDAGCAEDLLLFRFRSTIVVVAAAAAASVVALSLSWLRLQPSSLQIAVAVVVVVDIVVFVIGSGGGTIVRFCVGKGQRVSSSGFCRREREALCDFCVSSWAPDSR